MPADPETTAALSEVSTSLRFVGDRMTSLETTIKEVSDDGRRQSRELHEKIDNHAKEEREAMTEFGLKLQRAEDTQTAHERSDTEKFDRIEKALGSADEDRKSIWKTLGKYALWIAAAFGGAKGTGIIE